jgi:hypothetical protein
MSLVRIVPAMDSSVEHKHPLKLAPTATSWPPLLAGYTAMVVALCFQNITVVGDYLPVLLLALVFTVIADLCLFQAFHRGGTFVRWASGLGILPTLIVVVDVLSRLASSSPR